MGHFFIEENDMLNNIYGGGTMSPSDVYSTEEKVIGTWIDGKPLYRKVITGKCYNDIGSSRIYDFTDLSINEIVYFYVKLGKTTTAYSVMQQGANNNINIFIQNSRLYVDCTSDYRDEIITLTLEYTKTTD